MNRGGKHAPDVNRALFVKNLSFTVKAPELFSLFGRFGPIRQIRQGIAGNTKGTVFVVYEDVASAKNARESLNGYNFQGRYLVVLYHQPEKGVSKDGPLAPSKSSINQHQVGVE